MRLIVTHSDPGYSTCTMWDFDGNFFLDAGVRGENLREKKLCDLRFKKQFITFSLLQIVAKCFLFAVDPCLTSSIKAT